MIFDLYLWNMNVLTCVVIAITEVHMPGPLTTQNHEIGKIYRPPKSRLFATQIVHLLRLK